MKLPFATNSATASALAASRPGLIGVGVLTFGAALLPLAAAIYILLMLDVVLASRSAASLLGLFVLAVGFFGTQAWLLSLRDRMLSQIGDVLAMRLHRRMDAAIARSIETARSPGDGLQAARDLDAVRHFLSGRGAGAFADLPAAGLFLLVMLLLHGLLALALLATIWIAGAILAVAIRRANTGSRERTIAISERNTATEVGYRHAELVRVLGMHRRAADVRALGEYRLVESERRLADDGTNRLGFLRAVRLIGWASVLAIGAWLAITGRASAGVVVAAALIADRALQPFEDAVAHARDFALARLGWTRLTVMLEQVPPEETPLPLPAPTASLSVENVSLLTPHTRRVVLRDIAFELKAGDMLSVVGPSGSGKSALIRALANSWRPTAGKVRLDGGALDQWDPAELGRHIGYLPQNPELFDGTVSQNIARFDPHASSDEVIAAATAAGVHDVIVRLPEGYATEVGPGGASLPVGHRQRIALARALYGAPFLLLLDDPATFADARAQAALTEALQKARKRGAIIVATGPAHASLDPSNLLLILSEGQKQDYGPKDEVRARLMKARGGRPIPNQTAAAAAPVPSPQE